MSQFEIGIDIEKVNRFKNKDIKKNKIFLNKIFSKKEIDYCFSKKDASLHLAGKFAAKEAIVKAFSSINKTNFTYDQIEILNDHQGIPRAIISKNEMKIKLSISHTEEYAIAMVIVHD